jgi:short-subunit dehydrogenase
MSNFLSSLRIELGSSPIRIVDILPGFVKTPAIEGVPHPMPFMVSARYAAETILNGIADGQSVVAFPLPIVFASYFSFVVPNFIFERLMGTV